MKTVSVKVMRSYDYCHFEVALSTDDISDVAEINSLRIEAAKLVDRAVADYKEMKANEMRNANREYENQELSRKAKAIRENFPQSEWTAEQKAIVKAFDDAMFHPGWDYDPDY